MIKTKSRSCKGMNNKKHPQNMRAGYDYNLALQNLQCLILGAHGFNVKFSSLALSCYTP